MMKLYGYFRSGAAYRVRIALNLKGLEVEQISRHLRNGEQRDPAYLKINPQGLVPALVLEDGTVLTQSLAIMDWLDERTALQSKCAPITVCDVRSPKPWVRAVARI